jgi:hypothetical protein
MSAVEAVDALLVALGVAAADLLDTDGRAALLRGRLAGRRILLVFDNVRDASQVGTLLPGDPLCHVVVTSRNRLTGLVALADAQVVTLEVLPMVEAEELLAQRIGHPRLGAEPVAALP